MIYIIDDTEHDDTYSSYLSTIVNDISICMVKSCKVSDILSILDCLKTNPTEHIVFLHNSFQFLNHKGCRIEPDKNEMTKESFICQVRELGIQLILFSRGLYTNQANNTINKILFYENFKLFINKYHESNKYELDLLYHGENSEQIRLMSIAHLTISTIEGTDSLGELLEEEFIKNLNTLLIEDDATTIIKHWIAEKKTKKEIKKYINRLIK